jgi:hypothetical protein
VCWNPEGKWEELTDCVAKKGDPIPWILQIKGKEGFWDIEWGEWIAKRDRPPCGLIALARE